MKNSIKSVLAFVLLSGLVGTAMTAKSAPGARDSATPATLTYAYDVPVSVELPAEQTITVSEVTIAAPKATRSAPKASRTGSCAFGFRDVVQGPVGGQVRGFCN